MQTSPPRALVASIHDVSPLTMDRVNDMLRDLAEAGVRKTSLLVIPNHHYKAPVTEFPAFGTWLRELVAQGHEAVVHGYYHLRDDQKRSEGTASPGLKNRLITEFYTAGEGEFFDLSETEAAKRLERAKSEFAELGITSRGFIAPAWLLGQQAEEAVRRAGFDYTTRLATIKDLRSGRETATQSLVWSVRAGWRRALSLGWNASLAWRLRGLDVLRLGLHPPDWDHPAIREQALRLAHGAIADREVMTYDKLLGP